MNVESTTESMKIIVNGEPREIASGSSLGDLLEHLDLDPRMIVVEHNRSIVRRLRLADKQLQAGDQVELVHFVGGG